MRRYLNCLAQSALISVLEHNFVAQRSLKSHFLLIGTSEQVTIACYTADTALFHVYEFVDEHSLFITETTLSRNDYHGYSRSL